MDENKSVVDDESLDSVLSKVDLSEKTEMGEAAMHVFKTGKGRTNISNDEAILLFINKQIFSALGLDELDPTDDFIELKKSVEGWSTEKFVQVASGVQNQRAGGIMGKLFSPRQPGTQ